MSFKTVIAGLAAIAIVAGSALTPTVASAQHGHFRAGGRGFRGGGGGFGGFRGGFGGGWLGVYPGWGYELYPEPYYYGPSCGYVHVKYYRHHRAYWRLVYRCW
jgi:hypothetical protein